MTADLWKEPSSRGSIHPCGRPPSHHRLPESFPFLSLGDEVQEVPHRQQPCSLLGTVGRLDRNGDNQRKQTRLHLCGLALADSCLQGQQVLLLNSCRFRQYLTPSVLASGFHTEKTQPRCRKAR